MTADLDARWPSKIGRARLPVRNNLLLEACALARGLPTTRVSPGAFVVGEGGARVGFATTLSTESSRPATRVCADRTMRRTMLADAGVPVPLSASFGFQQAEEALDYAAALEAGVVVKPRAREAGFRRSPTADVARLRRRVAELRDALGPQETFLVEQWSTATPYTCYVVGGAVVSVVRRDGRAWAQEVYRDDDAEAGAVHPEILGLALRAVEALPALPHAAVQLTCPDLQTPEGALVVSVEPQVSLIGRIPPRSWSVRLADRMVAHATRSAASSTPLEEIAVRFEMTEVSRAPAMIDGVQQWIAESGVVGAVARTGEREVCGELTASPGQVVALSWLAARGRLAGRSPRTVVLTPRPG